MTPRPDARAAPRKRPPQPHPAPSALSDRIARAHPAMTPSERGIASYMLGHLHLLPFENAAGIAAKVGVSPITVGRFLRSIGYGGFGELKDELRGAAANLGLLVTDRFERIRGNGRGSDAALHDNLQLEINSLIGVYEHVGTPLWNRVVDRLVGSDQVFVAGFQTLGGLAADFAARLQYLRPGVGVLDGRDGTFAELLAGSAKKPSLVLFEMRRYTRFSRLLAEQCKQQGIAVTMVCDSHCHWARDSTDDVVTVDTASKLFWDSQAPFLSLTNLLLDHAARKLRQDAKARLQKLGDLQNRFGAFGTQGRELPR
jgi:DNA-binding MurR/RpiR family transcriptional regulator